MTIEELKCTHNVLVVNKIDTGGKLHTKLSIEFAIEVLEGIVKSYKEDISREIKSSTEWGLGYRGCSLDTLEGLNCKIQELKQYLNE